MADPEKPGTIDLDVVMAKIRREISERRAANPDLPGEPLFEAGLEGKSESLSAKIRQAGQYTEMGAALPDLGGLSAPKRLVGRRLGRAIMSLTSGMRGKQTWFNRYVLAAIEELGVSFKENRTKSEELEDLIGGLELELARLKARLAQQQYGSSGSGTSEGKEGKTESAQGDYPRRHKAPDRFDVLSSSLLNDFRGTEEDIQARLSVHLTSLTKASVGTLEFPVLDLGCGRGEWLQLLKEKGWHATGVDHNPILVRSCRERELDVSEGDAIQHLSSLPAESLGAVTAFHLVEHLPFQALLTFLDEAMRALKSGGLLIAETPNPDNLVVAAQNFWLDPTHHHPLPGKLLKALAEHEGFHQAQIQPLHPADPALHLPDSPVSPALNALFYGPQDYALVARKP